MKAVALFGLIVVAGCSESALTIDAGAPGDAAAPIDASGPDATPMDAGAADLTRGDLATSFLNCPAPGTPNSGILWIESPHALAVPNFPGQPAVAAAFSGSSLWVALDACPCVARDNPYVRGQPPDMSTPPDGFFEPQNAGTITIQNGANKTVLSDLPYGLYNGLSPGALFMPGDLLGFSATGGLVPAFQGTIHAPQTVTITSPASEATITHAQGDGLLVTWEGGQVGQAVVVDVSVPRFEALWEVRCLFDAAAGVGAVPANLLDQIADGSGPRIAAAEVHAGSASIGVSTPGDWTIEVRVATPALAKGGGDWGATIATP